MSLILAALGLAAAGLGAAGHMEAKETNKRAQSLAERAQEMFDKAKHSLEVAQSNAKTSLSTLGQSKKQVLDTSIQQFLVAFNRLPKSITLRESVGMNELSKFSITSQGALQLREMTNIYESNFSSGAAGAALGAAVTLGAGGSLSLTGAALGTTLSALAAPALLFTGLSASIKADENLEKAREMHAQASARVAKMEVQETLCKGVAQKANMFNSLLGELNGMFSACTALLDKVTLSKMGFLGVTRISAKKLTQEELNLAAVTRALAGAVKAVIDTPILTQDGSSISNEAQTVYDNMQTALPAFTAQVAEVKSYEFKEPTTRPLAVMLNSAMGGDGNIEATARNNKIMLALFATVTLFLGWLAISKIFPAKTTQTSVVETQVSSPVVSQTVTPVASSTPKPQQLAQTLLPDTNININNENTKTALTPAEKPQEPAATLPQKPKVSLFDTARTGKSSAVAQIIKKGADINERDKNGVTPLMVAAKYNSSAMINALVKAGANVNESDNSDWTPIMYAAAFNKSPDVIKALVQNGADVKVKNNAGKTALMLANETKNTAAINVLDPTQVKIKTKFKNLFDAAKSGTAQDIEQLVRGGANVNAQNAKGDTALLTAARTSRLEVMRALLDAGANVNLANKHGATPLSVSVYYAPSISVTKLLLQAGANVNTKDLDGDTPLTNAVLSKKSSAAVVEALVQAGANIHAKNKKGQTALTISSKPEITRILQRN